MVSNPKSLFCSIAVLFCKVFLFLCATSEKATQIWCLQWDMIFVLSQRKCEDLLNIASLVHVGLIKTHQLRQQAKYHQQQQQSKKTKTKLAESSSAEEEFFCLTPEDARSISSNTSERSRNASTASGHQIPDSKIFSVAVEAKTKDQPGSASGLNSMMVCDVDTDYTGRFAVVSSSENKRQGSSKKRNKVVVKQVSTEFKIEGNDALDQMVASFPEVNFRNFHLKIIILFNQFFNCRILVRNCWLKP